jgi:glutaminyl-peptide cyclotransferase
MRVDFVYCLIINLVYSFEIEKRVDHDKNCFTQGLVYHNNYLYESCGLNRESMVKKIDETGTVIATLKLDNEVFAEGNLF